MLSKVVFSLLQPQKFLQTNIQLSQLMFSWHVEIHTGSFSCNAVDPLYLDTTIFIKLTHPLILICHWSNQEPEVRSCPPGWTHFCPTDDHCACYQYVNKWLYWEDASDYCRDLQAHLPSVHSQREAEFLDELSNGDPRIPWIGLRLEDGGYEWTDGTPLDFIYWAPGEPNSNQDHLELCSQMRTSAYYHRYEPAEINQSGKWNDFKCSGHEETFFCKGYFLG